MIDIIKIVKSLEEPVLLIKGVGKTIENEAKKRRGGFHRMLLDSFGASLLGNLLTGKWKITVGESTIRAGRIFNAALSFNYFWNTKVLSKRS